MFKKARAGRDHARAILVHSKTFALEITPHLLLGGHRVVGGWRSIFMAQVAGLVPARGRLAESASVRGFRLAPLWLTRHYTQAMRGSHQGCRRRRERVYSWWHLAARQNLYPSRLGLGVA